jgi:glutathione S-transferase
MKLYLTPGVCSLASHITLREAGMSFQAIKVDLRSKKTEAGEDYLKINSKGYVPALQFDDGQVLTEVSAIMQYIADRNPESKLAPPAGTLERARLQEWLGFISTELHKSFSVYFNPAATDDWKKNTTQRLHMRLSWLNGQLGSKVFLLGENFTVADAYLFTVLNWTPMFPDLNLTQWPVLKSYYERLMTRRSIQEAMSAEGLTGTK